MLKRPKEDVPKEREQHGGDVVANAFSVNNWDDWFQNCGSLYGSLREYEGLMQKYYQIQNSKTPEGKDHAAKSYQSNHQSHFYDSHPMVPGWFVKKLCLFGLFGFVGGALSIMLILFVLAITGSHTHPIQYFLIRGGICGLLAAIGVSVILAVSHTHKVRKLCQGMRDLERAMQERICYVPPKYRNSQAVNAIYNLYCTYGVVTFNQAVEATDDYLYSNNLIGAYMTVMFDVPYKNAGNAQDSISDGRSGDRGLYSSGEKLSDPNLPDDIVSKTYKGAEDADAKLEELIGLEQIKTQVRQMKNRMNFYSGSSTERISGNHMVFLGPPGTGKTTIARIITRILYDFGYIRENKCVEIDGGYMKSPFVGQTAERASAILRYAMGGVLFIDEAYMLMDDKAGGSAGSEATGVLLKTMEDNKNDLVVIFAGYEDTVNRLLASNEGFASRVKYKLYFDNFSVEELKAIFQMMLGQYMQTGGYSIEPAAMDILAKHFAKERVIPGFGNARVVRNALDSILDNHADNFMKKEISDDQKYVLTVKDVSEYVKVRQKQMVEDGRNFIASRNLDSTIVSLQELKQKTKPGADDPDKALAALTGLDVVKEEIERMKAQFEFYDGKLDTEGNHMVFLGPPGTGKTTVASIMTGYLYKMGLVQENSYLDINGDFLRGMYLGHTGKRTEAVVQYSQGMVLFVDEAYLLSSSDGNADSFGQEAVGVLLDAMEKYRKNFVVIFAGYEREMDNFLDVNSGLRSRINLYFHFTSYTPHELAQMFKNVAKQHHFRVDKDVWVPFQRFLKTEVLDPTFSNGRYIRSFFENVKKSHIMNYAKKMYGEDKKYVITLQDIEPFLTSDSSMVAEDESGC